MDALESELELLRAIYGDELSLTQSNVSLLILPQRDSEGQDFVQARVSITYQPCFTLSLSDAKGLDSSQSALLSSNLTARLQSLQEEGTDTVLYPLLEYAKEELTRLNESVQGDCSICLEDFGLDIKTISRVPGCFHRFHKRCLKRLWMGNWTEAKRRSCEDVAGPNTFKLACPLCRHAVNLDDAKIALS